MKVYNQQTREFEEKEYVLKEDTGWINIKTGLNYRKLNNVVTISFDSLFDMNSGDAPWALIATLPVGFRPKKDVFASAFTNTVPPEALGLIVKPTGSLQLLSALNKPNRTVLGTITYPI